MGWPEWIAVALMAFGVFVRFALAKLDGESNQVKIGYAIGVVGSPILWFGILYWGGFFS